LRTGSFETMDPGRSFPFSLWIAAGVERRGRAPGRKGLYF